MTDPIETTLREALVSGPSEEGLRWLDRRMDAVMSRPAPNRWLPGFGRKAIVRPFALVAAFVVLAGAAVGAMGLLERTVASVPGWQAAWDGAEVLDIEQGRGDVVLTLERAYVDVNQVMVFLSIGGLGATPADSDPVWSANLVGPTGRQMLWSTGSGAIETPVAAIVEAWGPPEAVAGHYELRIDCLEIAPLRPDPGDDDAWCDKPLADPWRFAFDLPKPGGEIITGQSRETVGDATVSLIDLRLSETMLTAKLGLTVAGADATSWSPVEPGLVFKHDSVTITANQGVHLTTDPKDRGPDGDLNEISSMTGSGAISGRWTVEIPELWYVAGDDPLESQVRLPGPWIFEIEVP
jgi:hypothetical protein